MKYWLMKSEPGVYSIDDLKRDKKTSWEGVRNYQARNFMRDEMKLGDLVLFYHSNAEPPGIAGVAKITKEAFADHFAYDPKNKYFDPKASPKNPLWVMVEVGFMEKFPEIISLEDLKGNRELEGMLVLKRGMRLSVQPVEAKHFQNVLAMVSGRDGSSIK